ncbi:hypothetical protein HBN50_11385 [Halobacteriovorax sp. GB3]|uniref:hypothetical protein n=1 Tax=Halobacteriovorax sp. GB3 TaxID=2719615 RepID=UPI00236206EA|nr:hypothetical protein [Halobacteriovorax sp. GB3]MDD0853703.1 hypothetical protein [Halobacteriovorax sp. GB3]
MKALLCFKKSYISSSSLLKSMANYNKVIAASFISKNTPGPWVQAATATYEATKKAQQLHYSFSLMKFLSLKSTCSYLNIAQIVKSFPYKGQTSGLLLIRNFNGTAKITRKKWEIKKHILPINGKNPEIIKLNAIFHLKNNYTSPKTKLVWKEVSLPSKLPLPLRSY